MPGVVQEECMRRGIDPSDMGAVRQMVMGGTGNIYGGVDDRTSNHPSQQVPRFGSDLGFSPRGVQVPFFSHTVFIHMAAHLYSFLQGPFICACFV